MKTATSSSPQITIRQISFEIFDMKQGYARAKKEILELH